MITAKEISVREAQMLKGFMSSLPSIDRHRFITRVITRARLPRYHWYNWAYGRSRIPDCVKVIIEGEARQTVFTALSETA